VFSNIFHEILHSSFFTLHLFLYFCTRTTLSHRCVERRTGHILHKRRNCNALVLTIEESRKFKLLVKNKATGTPHGMYIYNPYWLLSVEQKSIGYIIYSSAWGFRRCSFRLTGQCESLSIVERVTGLAPRLNHRLLCNTLIISIGIL